MSNSNERCSIGDDAPTWSHYLNVSLVYLEDMGEFIYSNYLEDLFEFVYQHYLDVYYFGWLAWVFWPLVITFVLPVVLLLLVYASALFLQVYRLRHHIRDAYAMQPWAGARHMLCVFWDAQGYLWHGFEIEGFERIPEKGPALIVYYHGAIPIDIYYMIAKLLLKKNRHLRTVGDRFLFMIPGMRLLMEVFHVMPGTVSSCVDLMKEGHLLAIAPGGVREAYFSDEFYRVMWGKRTGFAKIAVEAKIPVIPMFTRNCRESFRSLSFGRAWLRWLYEKTRLPLVPLYGGFPVKLRTFIGEPIPYDPNLGPEQLAAKVHTAMEALVAKHQKIPGNIFRALSERFMTSPKVVSASTEEQSDSPSLNDSQPQLQSPSVSSHRNTSDESQGEQQHHMNRSSNHEAS